MQVERLAIPDLILCRPRRVADARGWFTETYNAARCADAGIAANFVQDNESLSRPRLTLRGLHFQRPPHAQAKLVRAAQGAAFDVAVDLRNGSSTYGRWCATVLTAAGGEQLFIPRGFAHGFLTLEPATVMSYKVDDVYAPACEAGLRWDDPTLAIGWPLDGAAPLLSDKDAALPAFAAFLPGAAT